MFSKFCKHLLGVHKNTTNLAIHVELGAYPLYIDIRIKMMLYTILQNKTMRRCGAVRCGAVRCGAGFPPSPPPPPPIISKDFSYPNKLYIVGKGIYRRVRIILNIGKNILISRFYEQFSQSSWILGHCWKYEKLSNS